MKLRFSFWLFIGSLAASPLLIAAGRSAPPPPLPESPTPQPDPKSARLVKTLKHDRPLWSCRFDSAGKYLFAGAQDAGLQRWELASGKKTTLVGHRSWVRRMAFAADGTTLLSGDYSGGLIWWDALSPQPKPQRTVPAHRGYLRGVAVSPNGRFIATGGNDKTVRIWSADDGKLIRELSGHQRHVYNVAFHPNGRTLMSGDLMGVIKKWTVDTWKPAGDFQGTDILVGWEGKFQADCGGVRGIAFSPDGKTVAIAGITNVTNPFAGVGTPTVVLFDYESGKRLRILTTKTKTTGHCWGVRWHPTANFLVGVCGTSAGYLSFWKPDSEKSFFDLKLPQVAYDVDLHPDGLRIATANYDKTVRIYDLTPKGKR